MWKKVGSDPSKQNYLAMGEQLLNSKDNRMSVEISKDGPNKGSTLVIGLAGDGDAGQYICILGSKDEKELKHTVLVRGKLFIHHSRGGGINMVWQLIKKFWNFTIFLGVL